MKKLKLLILCLLSIFCLNSCFTISSFVMDHGLAPGPGNDPFTYKLESLTPLLARKKITLKLPSGANISVPEGFRLIKYKNSYYDWHARLVNENSSDIEVGGKRVDWLSFSDDSLFLQNSKEKILLPIVIINAKLVEKIKLSSTRLNQKTYIIKAKLPKKEPTKKYSDTLIKEIDKDTYAFVNIAHTDGYINIEEHEKLKNFYLEFMKDW